jgi:hypothetical protein
MTHVHRDTGHLKIGENELFLYLGLDEVICSVINGDEFAHYRVLEI